MGCQGLAVPAQVMHHVVRVESSFNPYAIGVVGGRLVRQPKSLPEALSTVRMLESRGYNFSLGLAQVNRYNLQKYGLGSYERAFEPCSNLLAGSQILAECYRRSGADWGKSFSCYYSGNFTTGFRHGYVQKIYASMRQGRDVEEAPGAPAIEVVSRQARRTVPVSRFPLYTDGTAGAPAAQPATADVLPAQAPVMPTRAQQVPSRIVSITPAATAAREPLAQPMSPAQSSPSLVEARTAVAAPVMADPNQNTAGAAVVVSQPAVVSVSQPSTQAQEMSKGPSRPRKGARDPALVGSQVAEQDGAFVF
jgi:type IV secretion system protein VirB1